MSRAHAFPVIAALAVVAAVGLGACGSESAGLLPGATASEINANLDRVEQLAGEGECVGAQNEALQVSGQVEALQGVDGKLKQALAEGAARLSEVVAECEEEPEEETEPSIAPAQEPEAKEKPEKPDKAKPDKAKPEKPPKEEATETPSETTVPPASEEDEGGGEVPPVEAGTPSGGIGPGAPAGSE